MLGPTLRPGRDARIARPPELEAAAAPRMLPTEPPGANADAPGSPVSDSITAAAAAPLDTILDRCCGVFVPTMLVILPNLVGLPYRLETALVLESRDHVTRKKGITYKSTTLPCLVALVWFLRTSFSSWSHRG